MTSTMRRGALLAAAVLLTACGDDDSGAADSTAMTTASSGGEPRTVTVVGTTGEVEVPVTDEDIFALDEYAALGLLSLGVVPDRAATFMGDRSAAELLGAAGVELVAPSNVEVVAAADPAMIVGFGHPSHDELRPQLEALAPVVMPVYTEPWEDQLRTLGQVVGRDVEADAVIGRVDERIATMAEEIAASDHAGALVSLIIQFGDGTLFAYDQSTLAGTIIEQLGFERPPDQVNEDDSDFGYVPLSQEVLPEQAADIVIGAVDDLDAEGPSVLDEPLLDTSDSITGEVANSVWSVNTPLSAWWILNDIEAIVLDRGAIATSGDATELWAELTER